MHVRRISLVIITCLVCTSAQANSCVISNDFDILKRSYDQISYMCSRLVANINPNPPNVQVLLTSKLNIPNAFAFYDRDQKMILVTDQLLKMHNYNATLLAFIFGHELGHLQLNHASKETFFSKIKDALKNGALAALKSDNSIFGTGLNVSIKGYEAKYSQSHELAADKYSYDLLIKAGYSKQDALDALQILKNNHDSPAWRSFFASHPEPQKRIESIQNQ